MFMNRRTLNTCSLAYKQNIFQIWITLEKSVPLRTKKNYCCMIIQFTIPEQTGISWSKIKNYYFQATLLLIFWNAVLY